MKRMLYILAAPFLMAVSCKTVDVPDGRTTNEASMVVLRAYHEAVDAKIIGNYDEAISGFERVLRLDADNHAAMYELAGLFLNKGRITEADYYARNAHKLDPANVWYAALHAEVLALQGSFSEAALIYETLVEEHPDAYEYYFDWAYMLEQGGKYKEAIRVIERVETFTGVMEETVDFKARLHTRMNDLASAAAEVEKLIATDPSHVPFYLKLAQLYELNRQPENALKVYERILKVDPASGIALLSLADHYKSQGQYDKYLENMRKAFTNPDLDIDLKVRYLITYMPKIAMSDSIAREAIQLCGWLVEGHPEEAKAYATYGDVLYQVDSLDDALHQYYLSLRHDESVFSVWQQILYINSDLQRFDSVLYWSNQVIERYPNQATGFFFKGTAENRLKRHREAVESLDQAVLIGTQNPLMLSEIYSGLGDAHHALGDHVRSDSCYEQSLLINPNNAYVLNNYSYYLALRGEKLERAEEMARKANDIMPGMASFQDTYGWVLFRLERYKEAKTWIEKALAGGSGNSAEVLEHYGDVLFMLGEINAAVEYWQKAYNLEPTPELARKVSDRKL